MLFLVKRTLQIFSGLSVCSTIPFIPSFLEEKWEIKLPKGDERLISSDHREEVEVLKEVTENVMQQAVQRMQKTGEGGEKGCFWLFEERRRLELFMCVDMKTLDSPTLFHYARKEKSLSQEEKLNEVDEITYSGSSSLKMRFSNQKTKELDRYLGLSFAWLSKWTTSLLPKVHCKIERAEESREYTLNCDNPNKHGTGKFTKKVRPAAPYKNQN